MNLKKIMMFIRGWLPQEPKLPKNLLIKTQKPMQSNLRLTNSLKIVYTLTLGFTVLFYLLLISSYIRQDTSSISALTLIMWNLPSSLFINSLPLSIFGVVFLTKGNGLNYFRSWNADRKLQFSGLAIFIGYISIVFPFTIQIITNGPGIIFSPIYYYIIYFGLSLMTIGFVSLILLARGSRKNQDMSLN